MKSVVIYATSSGNTRRVAEAVADGVRSLGAVQVVAADDAPEVLPEADLVFVGGPTEGHTMTRPMSAFLERLPRGAIRGRSVATFDTRLRWPRILSGSAAVDIGKRLRTAGARLVAPPESFMVTTEPSLVPGELVRAAAWAVQVASALRPAAVGGPAR